MLSIKLFALLVASTLAAASPIVTRDAGTDLLITDLLRLDRAIRTITYAAGNYTGGAEGYRAIRESFSETNRTNRIAYYDAMTIKPRRSFSHFPHDAISDSNRKCTRIQRNHRRRFGSHHTGYQRRRERPHRKEIVDRRCWFLERDS